MEERKISGQQRKGILTTQQKYHQQPEQNYKLHQIYQQDNWLKNLTKKDASKKKKRKKEVASVHLRSVGGRFWMLDRLHIQGSSSTQARYVYVATGSE
jgi:hypothetical protein